MKLILNYAGNHTNIKSEINRQLKNLKNISIPELDRNKADIYFLAKCVSRIHSYNINQYKLPVYNFQWVINMITESENCEYARDIVSALKMMNEMEYYNNIGLKMKDKKFASWDIRNSKWRKDYKNGYTGSYVWDIAAIINYANDSSFSDIFLESYISYGGKKPALIAIYANLYYVQVAEAAINKNYEKILLATKEITDQNIFKTELISHETLNRLRILGY